MHHSNLIRVEPLSNGQRPNPELIEARTVNDRTLIGGALIAACALALSACTSLFGPGWPKLTASISIQHPTSNPPTLRADIGGRQVHLTPPAGTASHAATNVPGVRYGEVPVRVALLTTSGADTLAAAAFTQRFARDHDHWIAAEVGLRRPIGMCIGQLEVVPLPGERSDTLFIMHGSLPEGAIC
jgi:hypothetical protein